MSVSKLYCTKDHADLTYRNLSSILKEFPLLAKRPKRQELTDILAIRDAPELSLLSIGNIENSENNYFLANLKIQISKIISNRYFKNIHFRIG